MRKVEVEVSSEVERGRIPGPVLIKEQKEATPLNQGGPNAGFSSVVHIAVKGLILQHSIQLMVVS